MKNFPEKVVNNMLKKEGSEFTASDLVGQDEKGMDYDNIKEIREGGHKKQDEERR